MKTFNDTVQAAKSLESLCDILNSYEREISLSDACDLCSLPIFGKEPKNTMEVFSWNDTHMLIDNGTALEGDDWVLVERCTKCGEADFACICNS